MPILNRSTRSWRKSIKKQKTGTTTDYVKYFKIYRKNMLCNIKNHYICTVFFMVLDFKVSNEDWLSG